MEFGLERRTETLDPGVRDFIKVSLRHWRRKSRRRAVSIRTQPKRYLASPKRWALTRMNIPEEFGGGGLQP